MTNDQLLDGLTRPRNSAKQGSTVYESLPHLFVDGTDNLRPPYCTYCGTSDPEQWGKKCDNHFAVEQIGYASPDWLSYLAPLQSGEFPHHGEPGYENHHDHVYGKRYRWDQRQKEWVAR